MEERIKTNKEIFETLYPTERLKENPIICAEAIGYLKAVVQYFPSEYVWVYTEITRLTLIILFYSL